MLGLLPIMVAVALLIPIAAILIMVVTWTRKSRIREDVGGGLLSAIVMAGIGTIF